MRRHALVAFAVVAALLVTTAPVGAASSDLGVASVHSTGSDFEDATVAENLVVSGSGESASLELRSGSLLISDSFEDEPADSGLPSAWDSETGGGSPSVSNSRAYSGSQSFRVGGSGYYYPAEQPYSETTKPVELATFVESGSYSRLNFYNDGTRMFVVGMHNGDLQYYDGSYHTISTEPESGQWVWFRVYNIDMETDTYSVEWETSGASGSMHNISMEGDFAGGYDETRWRVFDSTAYIDGFRISDRPTSAQYISATHDVSQPSEAWVDFTISSGSATVAWQAWTGSSWITVNSATYTSSGNYSLDVSGPSYTTWRVDITSSKSGSGYDFAVHDEGLLYDGEPPDADGAAASPQGGPTTNAEHVQLSVPVSDADFATPQGDEVTVDIYVDGAVIDSQTISSNQTVSTTAQDLAEGSHDWHVELTDSYGETTTSQTWSFNVAHYSPDVDNGAASPQDGTTYQDPSVTMSIPVSDRDFAEASGDQLTVDFYVNGSQVASKTVSSNQTVSASHQPNLGGRHTWHVTVTDEYGKTVSSETFAFYTPMVVHFHPGTNTSALVEQEIRVVAYTVGGDYRTVRTTSDGTLRLGQMPDQQIILQANSTGFMQRQVLIQNPYAKRERHTVLLNATAQDTFSQCFALDSKGAGFSPDGTWLVTQRYLQNEWRDVSGGYFGAANKFCTGMDDEVRYRLVVADADDRRNLGGYTADRAFSGQIINLVVEGVTFGLERGTVYEWEAAAMGNESSGTIEFRFNSRGADVSDLHITVYEQNNESHVLDEITVQGDVGTYAISFPLDANETDETWVVDWSATRGESTTIEGSEPVSVVGGMLQFGLSDKWRKAALGGVFIAIIGAGGMIHAPLAAVAGAGFGGFMFVAGVFSAPQAVVYFAVSLAVVGATASMGGP